MLKKFLHWSAASVLLLTLSLFIGVTTIVNVARPPHIKNWVSKSGVYESLPGILIDEANKKQDTNDNGDLGISLKDPGVQDAAKSALSPSFLQSSTEKVIDGTFRWADGKVDKPDFSIDVGSAKQKFADNLAAYARQRYTTLPTCTANAIPSTVDPLTIACQLPAGIGNIDQRIDDLKLQITDSKDFLPQSVITADNIQGTESKESPFNKTEAPRAYQWIKILPLVLGGVAFLAALIMIFSTETKTAGLRHIGKICVSVGVMAGLIIWVGSIVIGKLGSKFTSQNNNDTAALFKNVVSSAVDAMQRDFLKTGLIMAGCVALFGVAVLIIAKFTGKGSSGVKSKPVEKAESHPVPATPTPAPLNKPESESPKKPVATKPRHQAKPTATNPTGPVGSSDKLIQ